ARPRPPSPRRRLAGAALGPGALVGPAAGGTEPSRGFGGAGAARRAGRPVAAAGGGRVAAPGQGDHGRPGRNASPSPTSLNGRVPRCLELLSQRGARRRADALASPLPVGPVRRGQCGRRLGGGDAAAAAVLPLAGAQGAPPAPP